MKSVYTSAVGTFLLCALVVLSSQLVQAAEEHLVEQITVTAVVIPGVLSRAYPSDLPPNENSGVPLNVEAGTDTVIFRGMSYPGSIISLLKNGTIIAEMPASPNGTFEIRVRNLRGGTYSFGIRAEDQERLRSTLELFTVYVSEGITTLVDGIFLSPTITTDKIWVKKGEPITILGKSVPNTYVTVTVHSDTKLLKKTRSNSSGAWLYKLDSNELELGDHTTKARSSTDDDISSLSDEIGFMVGDEDRVRGDNGPLGVKVKCDLNSDLRVNLKDFSIMAFWYKRLGFPTKVDMDSDGSITLTDFSILAWCWTG